MFFILIYLIITLLWYDIAAKPTSKAILGMILQPNPFKLGSCKFNIIINIINITFGSGVAAKPKILRYSFTERPNIFKS